MPNRSCFENRVYGEDFLFQFTRGAPITGGVQNGDDFNDYFFYPGC